MLLSEAPLRVGRSQVQDPQRLGGAFNRQGGDQGGDEVCAAHPRLEPPIECLVIEEQQPPFLRGQSCQSLAAPERRGGNDLVAEPLRGPDFQLIALRIVEHHRAAVGFGREGRRIQQGVEHPVGVVGDHRLIDLEAAGRHRRQLLGLVGQLGDRGAHFLEQVEGRTKRGEGIELQRDQQRVQGLRVQPHRANPAAERQLVLPGPKHRRPNHEVGDDLLGRHADGY